MVLDLRLSKDWVVVMTILLFLCEMAALQICLAAFFVGRILFQETKREAN